MVLKKIALIIIFSGVVKIGSSQPENPAGDPDVVPIAGIEYLLIGGAAYGIFEVLRNRNKMKIKDGR